MPCTCTLLGHLSPHQHTKHGPLETRQGLSRGGRPSLHLRATPPALQAAAGLHLQLLGSFPQRSSQARAAAHAECHFAQHGVPGTRRYSGSGSGGCSGRSTHAGAKLADGGADHHWRNVRRQRLLCALSWIAALAAATLIMLHGASQSCVLLRRRLQRAVVRDAGAKRANAGTERHLAITAAADAASAAAWPPMHSLHQQRSPVKSRGQQQQHAARGNCQVQRSWHRAAQAAVQQTLTLYSRCASPGTTAVVLHTRQPGMFCWSWLLPHREDKGS